MKCFVALVINLVVLVQIAQSHTIPPTIILAEKSEPNNDVGLQVNQDDNNLPEVTQPEANLNNTCKARFSQLILLKWNFQWIYSIKTNHGFH